MSWNKSSKELAALSTGQYRSTNSGPWEESYMKNLELSRTEGFGKLDDFSTEHSLDIATGLINNGRMRDVGNRINETMLKQDVVIFNTDPIDAVKGIIEETNVTRIFFSQTNIEALQNTIRFYVNKMSGQSISNQSPEQLFIIMRSIALQYGNFITNDSIKEVKRLNEKVISYCVENILTELKQYIGYIDDLTRLPVPMDNPHYANKNNFTYDTTNIPT